MFDPSVFFGEDTIGRRFQIKKRNKDGSTTSLEIEVLKLGRYSIYIEDISGKTIVEKPIGNETLANYWLPVQDILDAKS